MIVCQFVFSGSERERERERVEKYIYTELRETQPVDKRRGAL
jgi:hypothetical protein